MTQRKRIGIILAAGFIICLLSSLHYFYGIFTPYNYLTAKQDIATNQLKIIRYGEAEISDFQARKLAPKYGFKYQRGTNCSVTRPFVNGVEVYNRTIATELNKRFGPNWKDRFNFQIDSTFREERVDTIRKIAMSIDKIKQLSTSLEKSNDNRLKFYMEVLPQLKIKPNVRVGVLDPDRTLRVYWYYYIDPYTLNIRSVNY